MLTNRSRELLIARIGKNEMNSQLLTLLESVSLYHVIVGAGLDSTTQKRSILCPNIPAFSPDMEMCSGPSKHHVKCKVLDNFKFFSSLVEYLTFSYMQRQYLKCPLPSLHCLSPHILSSCSTFPY